MKILFLGLGTRGKDTSYESNRFVKELRKRNHTVSFALWSGISFSFSNKNSISIKAGGKDLKYFDYIIARSPSASKKSLSKKHKARISRLYRHYLLIIDYINSANKHILNEKVKSKMLFYDKLFQHYLLNKKGLPIVPSMLYTGHQQPASVYNTFQKPYIMKSIEGSRGVQVEKITSKKQSQEMIDKYGQGNVLVQKYIQGMRDYRVIVVNNKVVGGIERVAVAGEFRANVALGATTHKISVGKEMANLAIQATKVFNAEYAGVDIAEYKGKYYILEVNIFSMFEGFEKATGVSVPKVLAEYIEEKYLWSMENLIQERKYELFEDIYAIEKENEDRPLNKQEFRDTFLKHNAVIVIKENKPIAYTLYSTSTENTRNILRLVVKKQHRGQRIGRRMLQRIIMLSKQDNIAVIRATVSNKTPLRQQSFKRARFKKVEHINDFIIFEYILNNKN